MDASSDRASVVVPRREVPSGTVTFAFTDIEGSTQRWERDRSAMQTAVRRHDELVRAAIVANEGHVFKTIGDAFCAAFARTERAVAAILAAQRALAAEDFSAVDGLRMRAAIHTGTADERDGDYFGPTVNRVARLLAIGHGGQVLVSGTSAALLGDGLPHGASLHDLGMHRLKDLTEPEHVRQLVAPDLAIDFAPLRSLNAGQNNLPLQLTELIGRTDIVDEVKALLVRERLVTLLGAGGVGKTRLALQVGAELLDGSGDGVWFVELAGLRDASLVALEIASALGLTPPASGSALDAVVRHLAAHHLLLVLDNCEHVVNEAARAVSTLIRACPGVAVVATSREPLNVAGECVYRLAPLTVPPRATNITAADASQYAAVLLFVERAKAANRAFTLTDENAASVADIVQRLDGIALAIELAATRVSVLSVRNLATRLDERLRLLTGGTRTAIPHQRTMRALIDWSYELLSEPERVVLRRCAVFADGWTLEAAEEVCAADPIDANDVLDMLALLVDKSLVGANVGETTTRYRLLETTREYAREKLAEAGELDGTLRRHASWVSQFAQRVHKSYDSSLAWFAEIEAEVGNARAALDWSVTRGNDPAIGAEIVSWGFSGLWYFKSPNEGILWANAVLAVLDEDVYPVQVANLARTVGCLAPGDEAIAAFTRVIEVQDRFPTVVNTERSFCYCGIAGRLFDTHRFAEASDAIDRAFIVRAIEGPNVRSYSLMLETRAKIRMVCGQTDAARADLAEAEAGFARVGEMPGLAGVLLRLANLTYGEGDIASALDLLTKAAEIFRSRNVAHQGAEVLADLAVCRVDLGQEAAANRDARESLTMRLDARDPIDAGTFLAFARLAHVDGDAHAAARLAGYVDAHLGVNLTPDRSIQLAARAKLQTALVAAVEGVQLKTLLVEGAAFHEREAIACAERRPVARIA